MAGLLRKAKMSRMRLPRLVLYDKASLKNLSLALHTTRMVIPAHLRSFGKHRGEVDNIRSSEW